MYAKYKDYVPTKKEDFINDIYIEFKHINDIIAKKQNDLFKLEDFSESLPKFTKINNFVEKNNKPDDAVYVKKIKADYDANIDTMNHIHDEYNGFHENIDKCLVELEKIKNTIETYKKNSINREMEFYYKTIQSLNKIKVGSTSLEDLCINTITKHKIVPNSFHSTQHMASYHERRKSKGGNKQKTRKNLKIRK